MTIDTHHVPEIHTSDTIAFKRCRRKWYWSSPLYQWLEPISDTLNPHLWFGSGWHFALEDFHGYDNFGDPAKAFEAYYGSFHPNELPDEHEELLELAKGMASYYSEHWLPRRREFQTYWLEGVPQVEVPFAIRVPDITDVFGNPVYYVGTFDGIYVDSWQRLWIAEYKTAQRIDTNKLETDPQVSRYVWAARQLYNLPFEGVVYMQFVKATPHPPLVLKDGSFSLNKNQHTTYSVYVKALREKYGGVPKSYRSFLDHLASLETPDGDRFVRRDLVRRNLANFRATQWQIQAEVAEMLNPDLPIYPNPTRDCMWDCSFRTPCIMMDDGSDYETYLEGNYRRREVTHSWRSRIRYPEQELRSHEVPEDLKEHLRQAARRSREPQLVR